MTFQIGEKVVYPNQGVATVENISARSFGNQSIGDRDGGSTCLGPFVGTSAGTVDFLQMRSRGRAGKPITDFWRERAVTENFVEQAATVETVILH